MVSKASNDFQLMLRCMISSHRLDMKKNTFGGLPNNNLPLLKDDPTDILTQGGIRQKNIWRASTKYPLTTTDRQGALYYKKIPKYRGAAQLSYHLLTYTQERSNSGNRFFFLEIIIKWASTDKS